MAMTEEQLVLTEEQLAEVLNNLEQWFDKFEPEVRLYGHVALQVIRQLWAERERQRHELSSALYPNGIKHPQQGKWDWLIEKVKEHRAVMAQAKAVEVGELETLIEPHISDSVYSDQGDICGQWDAAKSAAQAILSRYNVTKKE